MLLLPVKRLKHIGIYCNPAQVTASEEAGVWYEENGPESHQAMQKQLNQQDLSFH